ncbi:DUF4157 domain-containing protein [Haloarcula sp. S1CR25-12]|uniref:DUF4157 domain-containing protein n=1 Tax=Haloarcula saliterrae TaxID=2950534 RepID=A0ABU2FEX9_9EURY|nr:DUF4157 domain-containing protein [Haloarcula sp. S1CR25-12]MDS0260820.1 DUF4157 domain-containing protein [Haloarcula sp. S1CR25-12]
MSFRSVSEAREEAGPAAMEPREDSRERQSASRDSGETHRFGVAPYRDGHETVLQRLAQQHGADQVRQWAAEGMPIETMGKTRDMEKFRDRQRERPSEVPTDIERQNAKSVQRSKGAHHESSFGGETQVPDSVRSVISSPGQQLDQSIQRAMEERMGDTLGDVRVHTGPQATKACDDINARAFTVGNHIAFNRGEYDPDSPEGQHVLAHELAHVRQQTGGAVSMLPREGALAIDPDEHLEREAEETAERVMRGGMLGIQRMRRADVHVQRLNEQEVSQEPLDELADAFDIESYMDTDAEIPEAGSKIPPEIGETVTRNLRRDVGELQTRGGINDRANLDQNIAVASLKVNGEKLWIAAASGKRESGESDTENPLLPGPFKDERVFDHREPGNGLSPIDMWDSEAKIIEHLANEFDLKSSAGSIAIYTERPPCNSCEKLIGKFSTEDENTEFDTIRISVSYDSKLERDNP